MDEKLSEHAEGKHTFISTLNSVPQGCRGTEHREHFHLKTGKALGVLAISAHLV